jgi:RNA polymerase primary sigma factor
MSMRRLVISNSITNRESESVEKYLQEIRKIDVLSPEAELQLFSLAKKGDKKALESLVKANLKFVVSVAKQYQNQGMPLLDLINEGNLGLIKALQHFDETKGFKFISYAVWWIRQHIIQALKEQGRLIRLPSNQVLLRRQILRTNALFEQTLERSATEDELAEALNVDAKDINIVLSNNANHVSLDSPSGDEEDSSLLETIENPNAEKTDRKMSHSESLKSDLEQSFRLLTDMQRQTVCLLFGIGADYAMSLDQISEKFCLSKERVRQIKEKALLKLRSMENSHLLRHYLTA